MIFVVAHFIFATSANNQILLIVYKKSTFRGLFTRNPSSVDCLQEIHRMWIVYKKSTTKGLNCLQEIHLPWIVYKKSTFRGLFTRNPPPKYNGPNRICRKIHHTHDKQTPSLSSQTKTVSQEHGLSLRIHSQYLHNPRSGPTSH